VLHKRRLPEEVKTVGDIELEPRYSTAQIPGKCIKCLAEQEYGNCLRELMRGQGENRELQERFEALVAFLRSTELKTIRDESEKYLAEGKDVTVVVHLGEEEPSYEIRIC